jgi:hypothetical protein
VFSKRCEGEALISSTQIEQVADRGRDVVSLLRVLPGVAYQAPTDAPGGNFGSTTPNINGNRATWNTLTVDGVVGNDPGSPQIFSSSINFDAIGEVQLEMNINAFTRGLLDNWQISVLTTLARGTPVYVTFTTVDGADITGGGDTTRFQRRAQRGDADCRQRGSESRRRSESAVQPAEPATTCATRRSSPPSIRPRGSTRPAIK